MLRLFSVFTGLFLSLGLLAQPPNRELLSLGTWALPGYEAVNMEEALDYPDELDIQGISDLDFTSAGNLILLNRGMYPFLEFNADGNFVRAFGAADLFAGTHGLTIDSEDNMWVTDFRGHTVMKLDQDANILMSLGTRGSAGEWNEAAGSHLFNQPNEVALDSQGNFYVAQGHGAGEPRILKFKADGTFITQWGSRGTDRDQLQVAHSIDIDEQDHIYVADRENHRVVVYDTEGSPITRVEVMEDWPMTKGSAPFGGELARDHALRPAGELDAP
jgi:DNA-binding beta-propeller fold protein YncE